MSIPRSLSLCLLLVGAAVQAADDAAERARIDRERAAVMARARAAEAQCADRFAVTACVEAARTERREALRSLDAQRAVLDDARRKRRAAERAQAVRERQQALAASSPRPAVQARSRAAASAPALAPAPAADSEARAAAAARVLAEEDRRAAQRAAAAASRADAAERHRREVERRNAERAKKGPKAAPLPLPGASAPSR